MSKMIFITGFARGGTSWLRDCIDFHPEVKKIPHEMLLFRDYRNDREKIIQEIEKSVKEEKLEANLFLNKAPANAPYVWEACRLFPESKFLFIIRDPRDVLVSHQRGNQKWMKGSNSTVVGCMKKTKKYYDGYLKAQKYNNLMLVKYEDLHQDFHQTMMKVYSFLGLKYDEQLIEKCFEKNNFTAATGRRVEDRNAAARKGAVGDWANFLSEKEKEWYKKDRYWRNFMQEYGYDWNVVSYYNILLAMKKANVKDLTEEEALNIELSPERPNLLLLHDIDKLSPDSAIESILNIAEMEGKLGLAGIYNFLPLDDLRYRLIKPQDLIGLINKIKHLSPRASIGLHLNATEKFFPADMESVDISNPDVKNALDYLQKQIDDYAKHGILFRFATAHGYGRGIKQPNNASKLIIEKLNKMGIRLFDNDLREEIQKEASHECRLHDVGGTLTIKRFPNNGSVIDSNSYLSFKPKSLINFLIHPGNYDVDNPMAISIRTNKIAALENGIN